MSVLERSDRRLGLVEQRLLPDHVGLAALATLRADIIGVDVASPVRPEIGARADERTRVGDDIEDALIQRLGRDWLGQEIVDAGGAPPNYAPLLPIADHHHH